MKKHNISKPQSKLLFIVQLPPPVHGVSMMNNYTVHSKLINSHYECHTLPLSFNDSIKDIGNVSFNKLIKFAQFYFKLARILLFLKPDLVYFTITPTGFSFYRDAFIVLLVKLTKGKIVLHLHGKGIQKETNKSKVKRYIYNNIFHNTHVIHLSKSLKTDLTNLEPSFKSYILPNGILEDSADDVPFQVNKNQEHPPKLLFLSNLAENKGVYTLLDAAKILKDRGVGFSLNYVGKETQAISVKDLTSKIKQYGLEGHVQYLGPKYDNEKKALLNSSDIFAFPTYNDCFPLAILEAMQAGMPVVSTVEGAIPDMIVDGEDGFIINHNEPHTLADKLQELITDPIKRTRFGVQAKNRFQQNFTLTQYEANLYRILLEIEQGK